MKKQRTGISYMCHIFTFMKMTRKLAASFRRHGGGFQGGYLGVQCSRHLPTYKELCVLATNVAVPMWTGWTSALLAAFYKCNLIKTGDYGHTIFHWFIKKEKQSPQTKFLNPFFFFLNFLRLNILHNPPNLLSPHYNPTPWLLAEQVRGSSNPDHGQCSRTTL